MTHTVGREVFWTKKEMMERVRSILRAYSLEQYVSREHFEFLLALLQRHPDAQQKIGCGVASIFVRAEPGGRGGACFWLVRTDGTTTDWSYRQCIAPRTDALGDFREACRVAVVDQVLAYKGAFFAVLPWTLCPVSGVRMTSDTCDIDHIAPDAFRSLVDRFIAAEGLLVQSVPLTGREDGASALQIADLALRARWQAFHLANARLRALDKNAHRALRRSSP